MSKELILPCPHCSNTTPLKVLHEYEIDIVFAVDEDDYAVNSKDIFEFLECPVCKGFHLLYTNLNSEEAYHDEYNKYAESEILYPLIDRVNLYGIPKNVRNAYESALKIKHIDYAICMVALRRTLERICVDKGQGGNEPLHLKILNLQKEGVLPVIMKDISIIIKQFGNMAAHGEEVTFNRYLVETMFKFINRILEFVYILPNEMKNIEIDLEEMTPKKATKNSEE